MNVVYDNVIFSLQKAGGISNYWYQLIKRIQNDITQSASFYESENDNLFRKQLNIESSKENRLPVRFLRYLPFTKSLPSHSIFHSSYYRYSLHSDSTNITTVYDFIYEYYDKNMGVSKLVHSLQKYLSVSHSQGIICISENTKKDLLNFYSFIDPEIVRVIYLGVDLEFQCLEDRYSRLLEFNHSLRSLKYILYVGNRKSYKNFSKVVEVAELNPDLSLVVVGGEKFLSEEEKLISSSLEGRIFYFQGVSSTELNILYNNAFCLLYPSLYEGFGIPLAEAMKAGCPVISTNFSSIPEVVGSTQMLVSEVAIDALMEKINMLRNEAIRNDVVEKGIKQVQDFSWDRCYEQTISFYEEIYKRSLLKK